MKDFILNSHDTQFLQNLLICPVCKARLDFIPDWVRCTSCGLQFRQPQKSYFDLLPHHLLGNPWNQWRERQQEMEKWYRDLIADPTQASHCFAHDYTPYASLLATLSGCILDVGGGNGIVRHFLPNADQYIVIDPSTDWLGVEWTYLAERFPCLKTRPCFVRGVGEYLPFPTQSFDGVLSFWSLNHANQPERVFREVYRTLRPGGRFLIILEDMEPRWRDITGRAFPSKGIAHMAAIFTQKFLCSLGTRKWPLQHDHIRIREVAIQKWASQGFKIILRAWIGPYLTFELQRI